MRIIEQIVKGMVWFNLLVSIPATGYIFTKEVLRANKIATVVVPPAESTSDPLCYRLLHVFKDELLDYIYFHCVVLALYWISDVSNALFALYLVYCRSGSTLPAKEDSSPKALAKRTKTVDRRKRQIAGFKWIGTVLLVFKGIYDFYHGVVISDPSDSESSVTSAILISVDLWKAVFIWAVVRFLKRLERNELFMVTELKERNREFGTMVLVSNSNSSGHSRMGSASTSAQQISENQYHNSDNSLVPILPPPVQSKSKSKPKTKGNRLQHNNCKKQDDICDQQQDHGLNEQKIKTSGDMNNRASASSSSADELREIVFGLATPLEPLKIAQSHLQRQEYEEKFPKDEDEAQILSNCKQEAVAFTASKPRSSPTIFENNVHVEPADDPSASPAPSPSDRHDPQNYQFVLVFDSDEKAQNSGRNQNNLQGQSQSQSLSLPGLESGSTKKRNTAVPIKKPTPQLHNNLAADLDLELVPDEEEIIQEQSPAVLEKEVAKKEPIVEEVLSSCSEVESLNSLEVEQEEEQVVVIEYEDKIQFDMYRSRDSLEPISSVSRTRTIKIPVMSLEYA